jgi:hypothetical protein
MRIHGINQAEDRTVNIRLVKASNAQHKEMQLHAILPSQLSGGREKKERAFFTIANGIIYLLCAPGVVERSSFARRFAGKCCCVR